MFKVSLYIYIYIYIYIYNVIIYIIKTNEISQTHMLNQFMIYTA